MPVEDINPITSTSSFDTNKYCVMIYSMPLSEEHISYIKEQLSIPINPYKRSGSYRRLLERAGFDDICENLYLVPDVSAVTATICATEMKHFTGWYGEKANQFLELNSNPYVLYSDVSNALQDMMYKASDWMDEPMYANNDELIEARYSLNGLCGLLNSYLLGMVGTATALAQSPPS